MGRPGDDNPLDALLRQLSAAPEEPPPFELTPGELLGGRYRIRRLIGRGGMGTVYEAEDEPAVGPVAVKVMREELATDRALRARFEREAEAAQQLSHPAIVRVLDHRASAERAFIVMELLRGETLRARLERESALPVESVRALVPVAQALQQAHAAGVVHRDVTPGNVFLTEAGETKLLDFGIAKLELSERVRLTRSGSGTLGTPAYIAPEQLDHARSVGPPADQYALGAVLYRALGGALPHPGETAQAIILAKAQRDPRPLSELRPGVPAALSAAIMRALEREPGARHPTMADFARALEAALA